MVEIFDYNSLYSTIFQENFSDNLIGLFLTVSLILYISIPYNLAYLLIAILSENLILLDFHNIACFSLTSYIVFSIFSFLFLFVLNSF